MPEKAQPWWKSGTKMHFDRAVSDDLLNALRPGGPLHGAVAWCAQDPDLRDLQLRREPKGPASWASLYVGLTSILDIYEQGGRFRLTAHPTHRQAGGFDGKWSTWQALEELASGWPAIKLYLDKAVGNVHGRWTDSEGRVHALISASPHTGLTVLNREASISFCDQKIKDEFREGWADVLVSALKAQNRTEPWWTMQMTNRLGTSPDFLAVDDAGRLLVIEAKPFNASAGITWGPTQVTLYATMYATWLASSGESARANLEALLEQRRALGLVPGEAVRTLARPLTVVPLLVLGPGMVSPEVWSRLDAVVKALSLVPGSTAPLEIWRLTSDGEPRKLDLSTMAVTFPVSTEDDIKRSTYEDRARAAAVAWKLTSLDMNDGCRADGPYGSRTNLYPFCLPVAESASNLLPEATGAVDFFKTRHIQWHRGTASGPTNHLVSSQVQCVNALFPMTSDPELIKRAFTCEKVQINEVQKLDEAYLTFEYNGGGTDFLGEGRNHKPLTRGANSTSTDAAFAFRSPEGRELALIEWKYTEKYLGSKLSEERKGRRELRYKDWYFSDDGPIDPQIVPYELIFVEPLYQLVRQQLLAWRIEQAKVFDRVRVLHISPATNREYGQSLDRHKHRQPGETVAGIWQRMLRPAYQDRFVSLGSAMFTDPARGLTSAAYRARYGHS